MNISVSKLTSEHVSKVPVSVGWWYLNGAKYFPPDAHFYHEPITKPTYLHQGGSNVDPLSMMNANTLWFTFHCRYVRMSFFIQNWVNYLTGRLNCVKVAEFEIQHHVGADRIRINQTMDEAKLNCTLGIFVQIFLDNAFWRILLVAGNGLSEAACHPCGLPW